jgi:alkylation response protein AidB-like acyl-CoA dehydrogenase
MDFGDSPGEAEFRQELRAWLKHNVPSQPLPDDDNARAEAEIRWHRALYQGGWVGASLPTEYGGQGRPATFDAILSEELGAAGAPPILDSVYLSQVVLAFGDQQQRQHWIPRMLSGEDWWCQGFSEPGAGSDLAALATTATVDGQHWVINGQKTWTTKAQWATHCLLLARSDRDVPRHKGITAFVIPMNTPGLTSRPIVQSTGHSEFSEVFLDDVRVGDSARLGACGDGWRLAMTTVTLERGPSDNGYAAKHRALLERLEQRVKGGSYSEAERRALARSYVDVEVLRIQIQQSLAQRVAEGGAGPASSADKLLMIRAEQALHHLALHLASNQIVMPDEREWLDEYLYSRAVSVYGGTEQVQRTIIAQRVLGLPRG